MRTLRKVEIENIVYCDLMPKTEDKKERTLYISEKYQGIGHLCLCGCGQDIFIGIHRGGWNLIKEKNDKITLTPSLFHKNGCKSHYIITKNVANFV